MKIAYVAQHGQFDNEDEIAITHALRELGHEVLLYQLFQGQLAANVKVDFCLYHKWENYPAMKMVAETNPLVGWFFDKVDGTGDPLMHERSLLRMNWVYEVTKLSRLLFFTDGDWVHFHQDSGKLRWLMQGADERKVGFGNAEECRVDVPEILFMGMVNHGSERARHIEHLQKRWGSRFGVDGNRARSRRHGRELANIMAKAKIIIAPSGPNTHRYWSNRVFQCKGFGAFLLHPYCSELNRFYSPVEVPQYSSWEECDAMIETYLNPAYANRVKESKELGYERTLKQNLYRHRCEQLIEEVRKVL